MRIRNIFLLLGPVLLASACSDQIVNSPGSPSFDHRPDHGGDASASYSYSVLSTAYSWPYAMNDDGVIVGYTDRGSQAAIWWKGGEEIIDLAGETGVAVDINSTETVAGTRGWDESQRSFV